MPLPDWHGAEYNLPFILHKAAMRMALIAAAPTGPQEEPQAARGGTCFLALAFEGGRPVLKVKRALELPET